MRARPALAAPIRLFLAGFLRNGEGRESKCSTRQGGAAHGTVHGLEGEGQGPSFLVPRPPESLAEADGRLAPGGPVG